VIDGRSLAALVPMRHNSERIPFKNTRALGGRPLYHHIVGTLLACPYVDVIVINTDSTIIGPDIVESFPGERIRVLPRPAHLLGGDVPMTRILLHDVQTVHSDYYLQTHSTNPLLTTATVTQAIERFFSAIGHHDTLFAVTPLRVRLWTGDGKAVNHDPAVLLRTQDLPPVFEENSNLYIFDRETLERTGRRIGERPMPFSVDREEAWDIDELLDFEVAEFLYARRQQ
jgi:CMP-N-acetylneuraminic acid synthetase